MKNIYLSDEDIQAVLSDYETRTAVLDEKIRAIKADLERLPESVYSYLSWYDGRGRGNTGTGREMSDPVAGVIQKKEREYTRIRMEFLHALKEQEERLALIRRIRLAYLSLDTEEYSAVRTLYEEGIPWKAAAEKLGFSKRKLITVRRRALANIRAYLADADNSRYEIPEQEIAEEAAGYDGSRKIKSKTGIHDPDAKA